MQDISNALAEIMKRENCSGIHAFFILADTEGDKYGLCKFQSKSSAETRRRLRDKSRVKGIE